MLKFDFIFLNIKSIKRRLKMACHSLGNSIWLSATDINMQNTFIRVSFCHLANWWN